jgi:hypothetical protein
MEPNQNPLYKEDELIPFSDTERVGDAIMKLANSFPIALPITLDSLKETYDKFHEAFLPIPAEYKDGADMSRATFDELGKSINLVKPQGKAWLGINVDSFVGVSIHIVDSIPFGVVEECKCKERNRIRFQLHDPLPPQGMSPYMLTNHIFSPYDTEIVQEISIEEAKKRWPNTPIPEK